MRRVLNYLNMDEKCRVFFLSTIWIFPMHREKIKMKVSRKAKTNKFLLALGF